MRSDRERERESNSIFSFVEETKTRLILSRQMDNSSEDTFSLPVGENWQRGEEATKIYRSDPR